MSNEFITSCVCVSPVCACRCVWELSSPSWSCKWHCRRARRDESSRDEARRNFHLFLCMFRHVVNSSPTSIWKSNSLHSTTPSLSLFLLASLWSSGQINARDILQHPSSWQRFPLGSLLLLFVLTACVCICVCVCGSMDVYISFYISLELCSDSAAVRTCVCVTVCVCVSLMGDITIAPPPLTVK